MQQAALLALSQRFPREKRSHRQPAWLGLEPTHRRGGRGGSAPRHVSSRGDSALSTQGMGVSGHPAREQLARAPGLSSKTFGLCPRTTRHGDDNAWLYCPSACQERFLTVPRSPDSLRKACCVHCSLQQPPPRQGLWEGSPGRKHLSAAFSMSAIPPSSSLTACPDPSQSCSRLSPPADLSATHGGTGWTQTKANHGRKFCQSDCNPAPQPAPHAHPAPLQADTSPCSPQLCFL